MGPMGNTLRGDTRVWAATDELGWFPYKDTAVAEADDDDAPLEDAEDDLRKRANGDEVHQALDNSLSTMRSEVWDLYKRDISTVPNGLNINISSPQSWKDKICRLLKESENPDTLRLGLRLPTWEINPRFQRDHPVISAAYAKNARRAERDFGANPPKLSATLFLKDAVQKSFTGKQHFKIIMGEHPEYTVGKIKELIVRNKWEPTCLALDAGLNNNSFALALGSRTESVVTVHAVIELIPSQNRPVFFPTIYSDVILPLVQQCNVVYMGADRWNSVFILQQAEHDTRDRKFPCRSIQMMLNVNHFENFKGQVNSGNLILPAFSEGWDFERIEEVNNYRRELKDRPVEHLYLQFMTVREHAGSFMKGDNNTDDCWRAVALLNSMLFNPKVMEYVREATPLENTRLSSRSIVLVAGRSGHSFMNMRR